METRLMDFTIKIFIYFVGLEMEVGDAYSVVDAIKYDAF